MSVLLRTLTGNRCQFSWLVRGTNFLGVRETRDVRCERRKGHHGPHRWQGFSKALPPAARTTHRHPEA